MAVENLNHGFKYLVLAMIIENPVNLMINISIIMPPLLKAKTGNNSSELYLNLKSLWFLGISDVKKVHFRLYKDAASLRKESLLQ